MNITSIVDSTGGFYPQDFVPGVLSPELVATAAWLSDEYPLMVYDLAIDVTSNNTWTCWFRRDPVDLSLGRTPPKFSLKARDEWNLTSRFLPGIDAIGEWVSALPMSGGNWLAFHHPSAGEDTDTVLRRWVQTFYPPSWDAIQPPPPAQSVPKTHPSPAGLRALCHRCSCRSRGPRLPHKVTRQRPAPESQTVS